MTSYLNLNYERKYMLSIIEVLAIFMCGYWCKCTRDYFIARKMEKLFASIPKKDKADMARKFINEQLNEKE